MFSTETFILVLGFAGQFLFFMRFFIQWIHSEKHKQSIVPEIFWYFSIGGSLLLLIYALVRKDIVFIVGQSTGLLIYVRNLMLIQRQKRNKVPA
ncbi:MAG TPA: lipid-A-disaccharide synthase N-terminal domain-containing protein [Syntrophales bacterium]|nr:lipid-A-disaccharide synthase N-terminal domain-containing protein [Syntrophales bacterium]HPX55448.1 lipid-A-disaccharide synthase N-terminal domain-containing protein [Syntrophales bacterium]